MKADPIAKYIFIRLFLLGFGFFLVSSFLIIRPAQSEDLKKEDCLACHKDLKPPTDVASLEKSIHRALSCTDCHQDVTEIPHSQKPGTVECSTCHPDIAAEHSSGVHHIGNKKEEVRYTTACTSCHGTHNILPRTDKNSPIYRAHIPLTCKKCHLDVFSNFIRSSHGRLWKEGDTHGPVCTTCHKAHKIERVFSKTFQTYMPQECGKCHEDKAPTYRDTFHGQATSIGYLVAAKCSDCHTAHLNLPKEDLDSTVNPKNLIVTCGKCHLGIDEKFIQYDPHPTPHDKAKAPLLFYISAFMVLLLKGVFGFFGIHTLLWLQRTLVALARGEIKRKWKEDRYVRRFDRRQRLTHIFVVISFLGLAATGIPLKYHYTEWAKVLSTFLGGVEVARYFHRLFAVITGGYALYHLYYLVHRFIVSSSLKQFSYQDSVLPRLKDLKDLFQNIRWFLYMGKRPEVGRWAYWEKFDYFAIFWGVPVIGLSGLILWFPEFFTRFFPGSVINLAMVIHSEEALLAIGFIFTFHFFHSHLRPDNFPLDPVIFTGSIPLDRFMEERPEEYARLQQTGKLESLLTGPPSEDVKQFSKIFGYTALAIGIALVICIFIAFFT